MADRGEHAVMRLRFHVDHRRAAGCQAARTRATSSAAFSGSGVSTTLRPRYRPASAASGPVRSAPAMGWPGTNCAQRPPRAARATSTTSALVLPASVRIARGERGQHPDQQVAQAAHGRGQQDHVGPGRRDLGADGLVNQAQFQRARQRLSVAPYPSTLPTLPARRSAAANEPPINPTPATARTGIRGQRPLIGGSGNTVHAARIALSASMKRAFSCGSPMDTRSHSGRPSPATGRTITPRLSNSRLMRGASPTCTSTKLP